MGELAADPVGVPRREADRARLATVEARKRPGDVRFAGEVRSHNILWPLLRLEPAGTPAYDKVQGSFTEFIESLRPSKLSYPFFKVKLLCCQCGLDR